MKKAKKKWKPYYNKAMQNEDEIFLKLAKEKVSEAKEPLIVRKKKKNTNRGRKPYNWKFNAVFNSISLQNCFCNFVNQW